MKYAKFIKKQEGSLSIIILSLLTLLNLILLWPIFQEGLLFGDDNTSNFAYTVRIAEMIQSGNFRFWLPDYSMGQPLFFYYQPIPHLLTALVFILFPGVSQIFLYKLITVLLILALPLSLYKGMRLMGIQPIGGVVSAILIGSVTSWKGYGYELNTVFWWGQFAQLWGMVFAPLALGYAYRAFFHTRKLAIPILVLGILMITHGLTGVVVCMAVATFFLLSDWNISQKIKDTKYLVSLFAGVFAISAVIIVPTLLYADYSDGFSTVDKSTHIGIGIIAVLKKLYAGQVFDKGHYPLITKGIFCALFICLALWIGRRKSEKHTNDRRIIGFLFINALIGLILISGTHTFKFIEYTPVINSLLALRLITLWHLIGVILLGFAIGKIWDRLIQLPRKLPNQILQIASFLAILWYIGLIGQRQVNFLQEKAKTFKFSENYKQSIDFLKEEPKGRVHVSEVSSHFRQHLLALYADKPIGAFYAASSHTNLSLYYLNKLKKTKASHYELFGIPYILIRNNRHSLKVGTSIYENDKYEVIQTSASRSNFEVIQSNTVCLSHNQPARKVVTNWMNTEDLVSNKEHITLAGNLPRTYFEEKGFTKFISLEAINKKTPAASCIIEDTEHKEQLEVSTESGIGKYLAFKMPENPPQNHGEILKESTEDGYYKATVSVLPNNRKTPSWIMVKASAHPDWKAIVDGEPVAWVQMSPSFMAVPVSEGIHTVEFEFTISPLRIGLFILSLLTIITLIVLLLRKSLASNEAKTLPNLGFSSKPEPETLDKVEELV